MGEAKRRAERRQEAREEQAAKDTRPKFRYITDAIPGVTLEQLKMRYAFLAGQFESFGDFLNAILEAGMGVCDHDVNALLAHQRGESKHVDPTAAPPDDRLVLPASEVPKEAVRALAEVSPTGYVGKRSGR